MGESEQSSLESPPRPKVAKISKTVPVDWSHPSGIPVMNKTQGFTPSPVGGHCKVVRMELL